MVPSDKLARSLLSSRQHSPTTTTTCRVLRKLAHNDVNCHFLASRKRFLRLRRNSNDRYRVEFGFLQRDATKRRKRRARPESRSTSDETLLFKNFSQTYSTTIALPRPRNLRRTTESTVNYEPRRPTIWRRLDENSRHTSAVSFCRNDGATHRRNFPIYFIYQYIFRVKAPR